MKTKLNSERDISVLFHPIKCKKGESSVSDLRQNLPTNMAKLARFRATYQGNTPIVSACSLNTPMSTITKPFKNLRPSYSTMSEDAGIQPRADATEIAKRPGPL
jgi:hypothetical protein